MRHEVVRHRHIDGRVELDALERTDVGRFDFDLFVEMGLERLTHETGEPHDAGALIRVERRIEASQNAPPAFGRNPHDGVRGDAELAHHRAIETDREPRAVAEFVREMIHAGVDVGPRAVPVVVMRGVVHSGQRGSLPYCSLSRSSRLSVSRSDTTKIVALSLVARWVIQLPCGRLKMSFG